MQQSYYLLFDLNQYIIFDHFYTINLQTGSITFQGTKSKVKLKYYLECGFNFKTDKRGFTRCNFVIE